MSERNQPIISGIEGTVTVHSDVDATTSAVLQNNWTATVAPAVTDDSASGYAVGSEWTDVTADKSYKLVDATVGAAVWKETTAAGGGGGSLYTNNDTVGGGRVATLTDTLEWRSGRTVRSNNTATTIVNFTTIIEVSSLGDFPTPVANVITLAADTTYLIKGTVDILNNELDVQVDNCAIVGKDRNKDILIASTLTGVMITVGADVATVPTNTEYNFTLDNLGLQAPLGKILEASNIDKTVATGDIFGRTKVLQITNCEIRDTKDVWTIVGFELIDLLNTLVWFITGTASPIGCQFQSVRHLEVSSCEVFNWSNSTVNVSNMIEILDDVISTGVGTPTIFNAVVNLNGCIIHPEWDQVGLKLNSGSETKFGTIGANTFIDANLNTPTGALFLPQTAGLIILPDYSQPQSVTYDIFGNQGIINSTAGICATLNQNLTFTTAGLKKIDTGTPATNATLQATNRFSVDPDGTITYNGLKQIYCSIHVTLSMEEGNINNDHNYKYYLYMDRGVGYTALPESDVEIDASGPTTTLPLSLLYGTLFNPNDKLQVWVEEVNGLNNVRIIDFQIVVRE